MRLCVFIVAIGKYILYIYIYIYIYYIYIVQISHNYIHIYIYIYIYCARKKTNKLQVHPYRPVSWFPPHQGKSPDEWATTKQACRDELVVYLSFSFFPPKIYTSLYSDVLSTVLRKSKFYTLYIFIYVYISFVFSSKRWWTVHVCCTSKEQYLFCNRVRVAVHTNIVLHQPLRGAIDNSNQ